MITATTGASIHRRPELLGQIAVVIGGGALDRNCPASPR
jgi:hypothetical protein